MGLSRREWIGIGAGTAALVLGLMAAGLWAATRCCPAETRLAARLACCAADGPCPCGTVRAGTAR